MQAEKREIRDLDLTPRVFNTLGRAQIVTIADLEGKSEDDLLSIPNFGRTQLVELVDVLSEQGLPLPEKSRYLDDSTIEVLKTVGEAMQESADHNYSILNGQITYLENEVERLQGELRAARVREALSARRIGWLLGYDIPDEDLL